MRSSPPAHPSHDHSHDTQNEDANTPDKRSGERVIGNPPQPSHLQSATSLTSQASIATSPQDPWLVRFAEPRTASIRWWTLVTGVIGIGLGILASFGYLLTQNIWPNIVLGLLTWLLLILGVSSMARFVLDIIVTQSAGRRVRQRLTEHVV